MKISLANKKVYVLHVQTGEENYVASMLSRQGYMTIVPSCNRLQRKGGKWNLIERLLFTSYVFIAIDEELTGANSSTPMSPTLPNLRELAS